MFQRFKFLYQRFMDKYPTNAEGLKVPQSVNILIACQVLIFTMIHAVMIASGRFDYRIDLNFNQIFFLLMVLIFSSYYRTKAINAGRGVVVHDTGEFIVLSSMVLFNSITITLITISIHIFSHFLFGLRNIHQLSFNYTNDLISGSVSYIFYLLYIRDMLQESNYMLILGTYILTLTYYLLNIFQTVIVVSLVSGNSIFSILINNFDRGDEFYIIVVSASAIIFTIITPNLYPLFYLLIFMLLIQQISKEEETREKNQAKLELKELHHKNEMGELKLRELEKLKVFAGKIGHDIRNYLTVLDGHLELSKQDIDKRNMARMRTAINDISEIIEYLTNFAARNKLFMEQVDINGFVEEIVELNLFKGDYDYEFQGHEQKILMEIDRIKMKQVLSNIIINAMEAIDQETGKIMVSIDINDHPDERVEIRIKDNGCGIPEKDLEKIFEPFYSTKKRGSGLGITTAESIILAHNGILKLESKEGEGTEFCISLPTKQTSTE